MQSEGVPQTCLEPPCRDIWPRRCARRRVTVTLVGGAPNTQVARFVAQLPEAEREATDTLLLRPPGPADATRAGRSRAPLHSSPVRRFAPPYSFSS